MGASQRHSGRDDRDVRRYGVDSRSFDRLARSLATPKTRRGLLGSLAALGAGLFGTRAVDAQVTQVSCGNQVCASNPGGCKAGCVCCVYPNGNSRCRPPQDCAAPGTVATTTTTPAPTTTTTTPAPTTTTTSTTTTPTTTVAPLLALQEVCVNVNQCDQSGGPTSCANNFCNFFSVVCCHTTGGSCRDVCDCCGSGFQCSVEGVCVSNF